MTPDERTIRLVLRRSLVMEAALRETAAELRAQGSYICAADAEGYAKGMASMRELILIVIGDEPPMQSITLADLTKMQIRAAQNARGA